MIITQAPATAPGEIRGFILFEGEIMEILLFLQYQTIHVMKRIAAIIERATDGTYSVYCKDEIFSGMGDTIAEAKADMLRQMEAYRETAKEEGFKYPEFLDGDFTIDYSVDAPSLMNYYLDKGWFSLATLEKITGISQKQLWAYANGTKPRKAQEERIRSGLMNISRDLDAIFA